MKALTESEIKLLSFSDSRIISFEFDPVSKTLRVKSEEAYIVDGPNVREVDSLELNLSFPKGFRVQKYENEQFTQILDITPDTALREICEYLVQDSKVEIKGFSKIEGIWLEFELLEPAASATHS